MLRMIPFQQDKRWLWTSLAGLLIFLFIQVFPITGQLFEADVHSVITRTEAKEQAITLAASRFGVQPDDIADTAITHITDSQTVGYLSKNKLLEDYNQQWSLTTPTDVYAADLQLKNGGGHLYLFIHMENGALLSWKHFTDKSVKTPPQLEKTASELASVALQYASFYNINPNNWEWNGTVNEDRSIQFNSRKSDLGESHLWMKVLVPSDFSLLASSYPPFIGGSVTYGVDVPAAYTDYMADQAQLSSNFTIFGFIIPQIIFFIIATVYLGTHGGYSFYRRGIFLSALFLVFYAAVTFNMIPGLRAASWDTMLGQGDGALTAVLVITIVIYACMALLTYFSAVAGDGLWKSMGKSLWPRWQEPTYGATVLRNMLEGYFLAFILLGAQSIILLLLEKSLGSFTSSDASSSMYNMNITWLLPLVAWCAGISEELQSRLFGIAIFRSWFVGGATKLIRKLFKRDPSRRAVIILTTAAMIPPGLMWGMGHVGYAIYPVYTRLIELVILAVLFGWFMLRFGIITVIFAHVTLDAILMGLQMMFDGLPGDIYGGLFSLVMPALVGIVIWWLHGVMRGKKAQKAPYSDPAAV